MSINNIYYTQEQAYKRYAKACKYTISGMRLDPDDHWRKVEFILINPDGTFKYEYDVIEIYSEKEYKFFLNKNRYLIENGLIKEYFDGPTAPVITNMMTDDEVEEIAGLRTLQKLEERLAVINSRATLQRIYDAAVEIGKSKRMLDAIQERINSIS